MLQKKPLRLGSLVGTIYDFPFVGDVLPMHSHDENNVHISIIARGSFRAHGNGLDRTLNCGDVVDWKANDPHEFISLEPDSRMVNIQRGI
jgi:quercetin dioxygenase-like cupin family protein